MKAQRHIASIIGARQKASAETLPPPIRDQRKMQASARVNRRQSHKMCYVYASRHNHSTLFFCILSTITTRLNLIKMKKLIFPPQKHACTGIKACMLVALLSTLLLPGCSSPLKVFSFSCQERQVEIYVDDEYLGRDLVHITVPKSREYINVSCRENGMEIYHKRFSVKGRKGQLFELQIPKNYRYSSKPY